MATVLDIKDLGYIDDYVYDLETEVGTFSTQDGLILKNTDSCYVMFQVDRNKYPEDESHSFMKEHFRLAEECAEHITRTFKPPIELEFEKVMYPFLLAKKKRYAYLEWTNPNKHNDIEYKGIQLARRDNCKYIREVSLSLLENLLYDKDIEKAKQTAIDGVQNLLDGNLPLDKLIISKGLNKYYKVNGMDTIWYDAMVSLPHVRLAQQLRELDPMGHPKPPDRVPYVFIVNNNKKALQYERVAHPDYLYNNKIDYLYYLDKQLTSPMEDILSLVMDEPSEVYMYLRQMYENKKNGYGKGITDYFKVNNDDNDKLIKSCVKKKKKSNTKSKDKSKDISTFFTKKSS